MNAPRQDPRLYGNAGLSGLDPKAPLTITEKDHRHRNVSECECHDCGNLIGKGEVMVVSAVDCTQGMKGKSHRYNVHEACYGVVGRVVALLGKDATHSFEGRPSLREMWRKHHEAIGKRDKPLAAALLAGLGKP